MIVSSWPLSGFLFHRVCILVVAHPQFEVFVEAFCSCFCVFFSICKDCEMASREQLLNNKVAILEAELNKARALLEGATPAGAAATPSGPVGTTMGTNVVSSEDFERLKNELTEVYRRNSESAQKMVDITTENNHLKDVVKEKEKEIMSLQDKCKHVETAASSADDTLKDKERTMSILRSELRSLQVKLVTTEGELRKANDEKEVVCYDSSGCFCYSFIILVL